MGLFGAIGATLLLSAGSADCPRLVSEPRTFERGATWKDVGTIKAGTSVWTIRIYSFINPENQHGNYELMFFKDGRYVGGYDMGVNTDCGVRGRTVICKGENEHRDEIVVNENGPPCFVIFGGYEAHFYGL